VESDIDVFVDTLKQAPSSSKNDVESDIDVFFAKIFHSTHQQLDAIGALEQRSDAWIESRKLRITASNFGAIVGLNPYSSPEKHLLEALFSTFAGNAATQYGSSHEAIACAAYLEGLNGRVCHRDSGLVISREMPFLGASPDGIMTANSSTFSTHPPIMRCPVVGQPGGSFDLVKTSYSPELGLSSVCSWTPPALFPHEFLLEIKCPFRKRLYGKIPDYYYAQIQGCMQILDLPYAHFYVWTPFTSSLDCFPRNDDWWHRFALPKLIDFYFLRYMPLVYLQSRGQLRGCASTGTAGPDWLLPSDGLCPEYVRRVFAHCALLALGFKK
jgi:putative phage-type endonuclease